MNEAIAYYPTSASNKTAVTLVAHGLNVNPLALLPLIHWLNDQGSVVYLVQLSGHRKSGIAIQEVTTAIWQEEMLAAYTIAKEAATIEELPLFFLGYSLGALLGQSMLALTYTEKSFDKQVLLAPATAIRNHAYLVRLLFFLGKKATLPSYTPKAYRINERLPLSIYQILFAEEKKVVQANFKGLNIPTLVILDPKDELISYRKLCSYSRTFGLTNYQFIVLDSDTNIRASNYHHLIIDEPSMGKANWTRSTTSMQQFLFPV